MTTQIIQRQVRFFDLARAMQAIASRPDAAIDMAMEVDAETVKLLESNLHAVIPKLNGDPLAKELEALLNHPFVEAPPIIVHERDVRAEGQPPRFEWKAIVKPGAALGDKNAAFECTFEGVALRIEKRGAADYEGFVNGRHFARSKFKKNMRERLEKEAIRRVG